MYRTRFLLTLSILFFPIASSATTAYDIDFKITNAQSYDSIDLTINYAAANGGFTGSGSTVSCTPNASLSTSNSFNDASPNLKSGTMQTSEFTGPVVLFTCVFDSNAGAPSSGNFTITLRGWSSGSTATPPTVQISRIALH